MGHRGRRRPRRGRVLSRPRARGANARADSIHRLSTRFCVDGSPRPHYVVSVGAGLAVGLKREAGGNPALPRSGMGNEGGHGTGRRAWEAAAGRWRRETSNEDEERETSERSQRFSPGSRSCPARFRLQVPSPKTCRQPRVAHRAVTGHGVFGGKTVGVAARDGSRRRRPPSRAERHPGFTLRLPRPRRPSRERTARRAPTHRSRR